MNYRIGSWLLVATALGLVSWFIWSATSFDSDSTPDPYKNAAKSTSKDTAVRVNQSTLLTADKSNRPFLVRAARAIQNESNTDEVALEEVSGEVTRNSGKLTFRSDRALYNSKTGRIDLIGNVKVVSPDQFVADLEKAQVSLDDQHVTSESKVNVVFDGGTVQAGGVDVMNDGARILFKNRVHTVIRDENQTEQVQ
ncbi:MAG: LPS export ABC transporter periplasmic protein LptC [Hyphomicrobiales bacterium]